MGKLTTHVLDTSSGKPGSNLRIALYRLNSKTSDAPRHHVASTITNRDGRADGPLLEGTDFKAGIYELIFQAGDYFRDQGVTLSDPAFLDEVIIRFGISSADDHYHVPLLISPYGYSTYRGS